MALGIRNVTRMARHLTLLGTVFMLGWSGLASAAELVIWHAYRGQEKTAFLFPGQGALYANMAGDLPRRFPCVADTLRRFDTISRRVGGTAVLPVLVCEGAVSEEERQRLDEVLAFPEWNHPVMLTFVAGLLDLLQRVGIRADMVVLLRG